MRSTFGIECQSAFFFRKGFDLLYLLIQNQAIRFGSVLTLFSPLLNTLAQNLCRGFQGEDSSGYVPLSGQFQKRRALIAFQERGVNDHRIAAREDVVGDFQ